MKLFKSLLLASATGLVAVTGASAADLGAKKPSPVEYVRACYNPLWGTSGGFVIPGTQTCVRVFGQARFDYAYVQQFNRVAAPSGFRGGAIVGLDAITPSEYGNVRAFAQIGMLYRSGNQVSGTGIRQGTFVGGAFGGNTGAIPFGTATTGSGLGLNSGGTELVFSGFIQFAGITAGRTASFFDPFFVPEIIGTTLRSAPGNVNLIAYTAALGNGLTATVSVEDPTFRRFPIVSSDFVGGAAPASPLFPGFNQYGGYAVPHIVGALQLDQAWGSAKVSAVLTNVRPAFTVGGAGSNVVIPGIAAGTASMPSTKYGFAVMGALKINLPMIAAGDNLVLTGVYGEGATSYVFSNYFAGSLANQIVGGVGVNVGDAAVSLTSGSLRLSKAFAVSAGFQHFWTPSLSSTVFGSYAEYDAPGGNALDVRQFNRDAKMYAVGVNTIWQPVRGLNIGAEVAYSYFDPQGRVADLNKNFGFGGGGLFVPAVVSCSATGLGCSTKSSDGQLQARLRITRDF